MILALKDLSCGYSKVPVLSKISFTVKTGEILCILGPNGVGKTTLFKSMLGVLKPLDGHVEIDTQDIGRWTNRQKAEYIGYIPQSHIPPFPYTVLQVVVMGCVSKLGLFASPSQKDYEVAEEAIEKLGITNLKNRIYTELSGGERQMVLIARALAQKPKILLMDEPTANLDYGNQACVLKQIQLLAKQGMLIIMTTHAPDHAFLCASKVILLERNNSFIFGDANEIVTQENLRRAYGIDVCILTAQKNNDTIRSCVPLLS